MDIPQGSTPTLSVPCTTAGSGTLGSYYEYVNGGTAFAGSGSAAYALGSNQVVVAVTLSATDTGALGDLLTVATDNTGAVLGYRLDTVVPASGADPWATALPGSYTAGQAGYIVGTNLDATVASRSTYAGGAVASVTGNVGGNVNGTVGAAASVTGNVGGNVNGTSGLTSAAIAAVAAAILNGSNTIDTALSLAQAIKLITAVLAGKSSISGAQVTYLDTTGSIQRVIATLDGTGQRTAMMYNIT